MEKTRWYKNAVIYQIYPRSFCDSNGDGIGDLKGITSKLDYLSDLGINCVWLSPCYKSPNADNGYDISDYRDIMDDFGTLDDWKEMIAKMHEKGIRLVMDLVVNHTSDEHKWFEESRKSIDNPYRDYYIWRKPKKGKKYPNNWTSRFGGTAWEYDARTSEYYMHLWAVKQPDLNWENPKVREEVHALVKYWLDLGVDGFRCDVITYISKSYNADGSIPDGKWNIGIRGDEKFLHGPRIHEYLQDLNKEVLSHYDCMTVGEAAGVTIEQGLLYTGEDRGELDTVFQFEHVESDMFMQVIPVKFSLPKFKKALSKWQIALYGKGWNSLYLENHDQPRSIARFAGKYGDKRKEAAKMLAVAMHMQQGCPYIYQGQEIGMTNMHFTEVDQMRDQLALNINEIGKKIPFFKTIFLAVMNKRSRDHGRTPMQWNDKENAGFSSGKPWFDPNPNYKEINVEEAMKDENSIYHFYQKLVKLRLNSEFSDIIREGTYTDYYLKNKDLYMYTRTLNDRKLIVICNFKNKKVGLVIPEELKGKESKIVIHNYNTNIKLDDLMLEPYEAIVFEQK
ncbi:MAG: alpha-glucosidase [Clostridia bacterium]